MVLLLKGLGDTGDIIGVFDAWDPLNMSKYL
jgi:hypothetical protein